MLKQPNAVQLRQIIQKRFSDLEFKTLCFDLDDVDYAGLSGNSKDEKVLSLLQNLSNRNRLKDVESWIKLNRSDINLDSSQRTEQNAPLSSQNPNLKREKETVESESSSRNKYIIDRIPAIDLFDIMLRGSADHCILRIVGGAKMGKSHLLKEFHRRAMMDFKMKCAAIELGEQLADVQTVLFALKNQLLEFPFNGFEEAVKNQSIQRIGLQNSKLSLPKSSLQSKEQEDQTLDKQRKLTAAFIQDLKARHKEEPLLLCFDTIDHAPNLHSWFQQELLSGISQLKNIFVVVAGRELPNTPIGLSWQSKDYELVPFEYRHYEEFREREKLNIPDEILQAFYKAFEGKPGNIVEVAPKFKGAG